MASTKIINVQKGDSFEEVFDAFTNTSASDVIFIFPKGSRFSRDGGYLETIKTEADKKGKKVSVVSSDPIIIRLAANYDFELLVNPGKPVASSTAALLDMDQDDDQIMSDDSEQDTEQTPVDLEQDWQSNISEEGNDQIDSETEPEYQDGQDETEKEPLAEATLAAARGQTKRAVRDVIKEDPRQSLRVRGRSDDTFEIDVRSQKVGTGADIAQIWSNRKSSSVLPKSWLSGKKKSKLRVVILIILGIAVLGAIIAYGTLSRATIIIIPQKRELDFQIKASAAVSTTAVNYEFNRIPGQTFNAQDSVEENFSVTGQKNVVQKASGKIIIYNQGPLAQRLVATTRFETSKGLIFRIPETVTVPGSVKKDGTVIPGSVESVVYADRPGPEYNIGTAKFTVPGFKGSSKYEEFFALSTRPMTGGIIGPAKVITESDFSKAQETLNSKLKGKILDDLKNQAGGLAVPDSIEIKFAAPVVNARAGEAADELKMSIQGSAQVIAFRQSNVIELVKNYLAKNGDWELIDKNLAINYLDSLIDSQSKTMTFSAKIKGFAAKRIDKEKILKDVLGINETAIRLYFKSLKEVESARVILSPFWVGKIPTDPKKVKIYINID